MKKHTLLDTHDELRLLAEARLQSQAVETSTTESIDNIQRLIHELQVHQIKLEIQNEALKEALYVAERDRRFFDLYEFAPVAYCSITPDSSIRLINKAASSLLHTDCTPLKMQRLGAYIDRDALPIFNACLTKAFSSKDIATCELYLCTESNGSPIQVRIDAIADEKQQVCNLTLTDISELKRIEAKLRMSMQDMDRAQAVAHVGSWRLTFKTNELIWSPENYRIFGLPPGTLLAYEVFLDCVHPDDREYVNQQWSAALLGKPYDADHRIIVQNKTRWIHGQATLEFNEAGVLVSAFGTTQDITERKQLELDIRTRDSYRQAILDNIPCLAWLKDERSRYLAVNTSFATTFGQASPESLVGKSDFDIVPIEMANGFRHEDRLVLEQGISKRTEEIIQAADKQRLFETWKSPVIVDGRTIGTVGFSLDISEAREMTNRLRESEAFNIAILNSLTVQVVVLDDNGLIVAANEAWQKFAATGYGTALAEHDIGLHFCSACGSAVEQPCRRENCEIWDGIEAVMLGHRSFYSLDYHCKNRDLARWFRMSVHPLPAPRRGVVVAHEDITELKKAVDEQKIAKAEAEYANHAKSRFLAAASHDLRQPLFALTLYVGMLKNKIQPTESTLLGNMASCVSSLNELLTDLLDISKLDAGVITPDIRDFPISELLDNLVSVHAPEAVLKGLKLRCRKSNLIARTDLVLYRRMIGNLMSNAVRYTEHGGFLVCCRRHQGKTWLEVRDTGIGIPENMMGDIFEEFRQLGPGERNRGSGLGLAIFAKAAALLGLEIRFCSKLGKGSLFAVELPLGKLSQIDARREVKIRPLRIALVDNNLNVLNALCSALEESGHQVLAATNCEELLELLDSEAPDVVISDFRLDQRQTGFDVIAAVRREFGDGLPALLITGDTDPKLVRSMAERGVMVQHKPLEIETLELCIATLTNRRGACQN